MILIKKYLDGNANEVNDCRPPNADAVLLSTIEAYRSALHAIGDCGLRACPALGPGLKQNMMHLAESLPRTATPLVVQDIEKQVEQHLHDWGEKTADYFQRRAGDVREILVVLARAAESVAERDQRYASQFAEFTKRLQAMAELEDLPQIRSAVMRGAKDLKTCVDKMEQDSRSSVAALRTQVSTYQTKLEEAEQRATHDPLTGLENRQGVEAKLQRRIDAQSTFCVIMLDLNHFKEVNDAYGHEAGDDLLKQFSAELRSASRVTDVVGRWGGDEFVIVLDGSLAEAQSHIERMQKWVFGNYTLRLGDKEPKVEMTAAVGVAEYQCGEEIKGVLSRADTLMYKYKAEMHKQKQPPPAPHVK